MNDLILYNTEDGKSRIKLRAARQTVWLSQREMAELFDVTYISHHGVQKFVIYFQKIK